MNIFCGSRSLCHSCSNNCAPGIGDDSGLAGERRVTPNDTSPRPRRPCILNSDSFFGLMDPEDEVTEIGRIIGNDLPVVAA